MRVPNYSHELRGLFNCREIEITSIDCPHCIALLHHTHPIAITATSVNHHSPTNHPTWLPYHPQLKQAMLERESQKEREIERERGEREYTFYYLHRHTYKHFFNKEITCSSSSSASSSASVGAFASSSTCLASRVWRICLRFLITRFKRANALKQTGQIPPNFLPKIPLFL